MVREDEYTPPKNCNAPWHEVDPWQPADVMRDIRERLSTGLKKWPGERDFDYSMRAQQWRDYLLRLWWLAKKDLEG